MIPNKCMQVVNETIVGNYTESLLLYHPRPGHHGHILSCTATNNNIKKDITREDRIKLQIFCKCNFKDNFIVIFVYLVIFDNCSIDLVKRCQPGSFETILTANSTGKRPKSVIYISKKVGNFGKALVVPRKI